MADSSLNNMPLQPSKPDVHLIRQVRRRESKLRQVSDDAMRQEAQRLRYELQCGRPIRQLVPAAFGLVVEAARRTAGMAHFDVQIQGGLDLLRLRIAEMKTGEGKTLTATLPVSLYALLGRGAHVATVNDYLAERDAREMGPIYSQLGLSTGVIQSGTSPAERRAAYRCDVTYGAAREFGFDFLRDRIARTHPQNAASQRRGAVSASTLQRPLHFALVDEADSILIDEARTPLVIATATGPEQQAEIDCFRWSAAHAGEFQEQIDYAYDHRQRRVQLTASGIRRLRALPGNEGTRRYGISRLGHFLENAIKVARDYQRDQHYALRDGDVVIVDEFTGRIAEGRQWQDGIHQAVQAREQLEITPKNRQAAAITVQALFRLYPRFAGMTGTAWTARREFKRVFDKTVTRVPTNQPVRRTALPVRIYSDVEQKWAAIVAETKQMVKAGRSVLIGTRSIDKSERLSQLMTEADITHQVLNARQTSREAEIVAVAGQSGCVTVATNMAGRGTDICLANSVREAGGLHVILSELHEAQRIDWQLIGRGSRQGDPGSFRIFLSLDDELLSLGLGPLRQERLLARYRNGSCLPPRLIRLFRLAQRILQRRYLVDRMVLLRSDKDRRQSCFEMGTDPFLDPISGR